MRKTFLLSSTCDHFLHRHKAESRLEIHWLHHEWGSDYFPIDSSTQFVSNSRLLRTNSSGGSKNESSRRTRTDEVDGTLQLIEALKSRSCVEVDPPILLSNIGGAQVVKDLETLRLGTRQMQRYGEIQRLTNTQSSACKTQWWEWLWIKSEYTAGKGWGWSKVSPTSPRDMLKVVNTLPGSDTGFLHRVFGKICASIVTLQNVLLTLAHLGCSCGSYHMKRTKVNILRQLSLSPYRQLKHIKAHWSWRKCRRYRGIRHLFTSPQNLLRGHPNICFDVGGLGVKWCETVHRVAIWNQAKEKLQWKI